MSIRDRFPIFQDKTYINSCSQGALSVDVIEAYQSYLRDWQEQGSPWDAWVGKLEATRHAFAGLVNARADEIAVVASVSDGVSSLAGALDLSGPRNKIVATDFDFPTTAQIWHAQEARGAHVVHVQAAGNQLPIERFADAIDERTLLVSIPHVCYRNGAKTDPRPIIELAHAKGALVLLDAYQSLGTTRMDVRELDVDFLTGGALKYLLGSPGVAFLYARADLLPRLDPTSTGWFAQADIFAMDIYRHTPSPTARRFESGTPVVPATYAALAGLKLIQSIGVDVIERQIGAVTDALKAEAMRRGWNLVSPVDPAKHGALITLRSHKVDLLVKWLAQDGIIVSSRDDNLRISPHVYNDQADVDRLVAALAKHRELLV
ncbi:MAG: aminotransferase class V-fold PLP-dependent enzyme [Caldilineaceae bacterium]|nr:aminotransferase class V-fold PLP-dependent enzyme [Caldilineaceae bacterium]